MKGFIIYTTYRIINKEAYICLFGRLENNEGFLTINKFKPYFYIKKEDLDIALDIEKFNYEKTKLINFSNKPVIKIVLDLPQDVPKLRQKLESASIVCYEADIRFAQRFLIDHNIKGGVEIIGDYTKENRIDNVYKEPELKPTFFIPKLKVLSMDIETDEKAEKIYSIALYSNNYKKTFLVGGSEEKVLTELQEEILNLDPDIITGWSVIDFDLVVLQKKYNEYMMPFQIARDNSKLKLKIESDFFKESKADLPGRQVLDALSSIKQTLSVLPDLKQFIKLRDYKLETAANVILNEKKLIDSKDKGEQINHLYKNNPKKLLEYNLKDAELAYKILERSRVLELTIYRSLLTGMPIDRVNSSIASFDSLYLRKARERNLVCPSSSFKKKEKPIIGGFVMEPKPGIYDYILVLDFSSLYPSIMRTFNIDPASFRDKKVKNAIETPNKAYFLNADGILPEIIKELYEKRLEAKKNKDEMTSYAIKILMNSIFGSIANPTCRFFNMKIANAITTTGQEIIKLTAKKIKERGYEVIYGDTDSVFINSYATNLDEANKVGNKLAYAINEFYKEYIRKQYKRESFLKFEYDKCFIRFLMPKIRSEEKGAKKRYAGLIIKNGKEEIDITGMEAIRGDWTELAKKFQYELLNLIFHKREVKDFIRKFVEDTTLGKYDDLLIYRKQLRKGLEGYMVKSPHLVAAKKSKDFRGGIVEYYITEDGPEPIENLKHKIDYNHYIEKQIKPIADSILTFFNTNFEKIVKETLQSQLFDFKK